MSKCDGRMDKNSTLIFVHIPKTAGRTLETILERQYRSDEIYNIYGYKMSIPESVKKLKNLPEKDKREIKLIKGHYEFGLHQTLPQKSNYITLLRNPIGRVISHYYYVLREDAHPLNSIVKSKKMSLKDYVTSGISTELDNGQTRLISGMENHYGFGQCKADILETAKNNLDEHFLIAGLVERFDESLALMSLETGWDRIYYMKRNVSQKRPTKVKVAGETLLSLERHNELDLELYEYAAHRLEVLIDKWADLFDQRLRKLKRQNHVYQLAGKPVTYALYCIGKLRDFLKK